MSGAARVWDAFLTEQDRAFDKARAIREDAKRRRGTRPALLLIDLYRAAFGDRPAPLLEAIQSEPSSCGMAAWESLPHLERMLASARSAGIPVIHVTRLVELSQWGELGRADRQPSEEELAERRRRFTIVEQLAPQPGELVLHKRSTSPFTSTALAAVLNQLRVDTLIVVGESTSGCVRATVVDGRALRYSVVVPEECVFDRTQASHAMSLYDMHRKYAHVEPLEDTLAYLRTIDATRLHEPADANKGPPEGLVRVMATIPAIARRPNSAR